MHRRGIGGWSVLLTALVAAPGCVDIVATNSRVVEREEQTFAVSGAPNVVLRTFDGAVEVDSWDRPEVLVVVEKHGSDDRAVDSIQVDLSQTGNDVDVNVRETGSDHAFGFADRRGAAIHVTVPREARVHARTGDGRIALRGVRGDLSLQTGDGSIRLDDVDGSVDAQSGDGSIRVKGHLTRVRARSGDGSVTVHAEPGSAAADDWTIVTGDGTVTLEVPAEFDADLEASTSDGRVRVDDELANREGATADRRSDRQSFRGRLGRGGRHVTIQTGDGSISVRKS